LDGKNGECVGNPPLSSGLVLNPTHGDAFNNETCSTAGAFLFEFWFVLCSACESVGGVQASDFVRAWYACGLGF